MFKVNVLIVDVFVGFLEYGMNLLIVMGVGIVFLAGCNMFAASILFF